MQLWGNITAYSEASSRYVSVINISTSSMLRCLKGKKGCEPLNLYELDVIDYTQYSLNLTFNDSNLPQLARDKNLTMSFVFSFVNPDFATGQVVARAVLWTVALAVLIAYSIALCMAHIRPLPEQQWVRGALLLLLLFQDPVLFLKFVAGGSSASAHSVMAEIAAPQWLTNDVQVVYVASLLLHYFAVLGLYLFWAMMIHSVGLPAPGDEARILQEKVDRQSEAAVAAAEASGRELDDPLLDPPPPAQGGFTVTDSTEDISVKGYPWAFYAPKLTVALASFLGLVASWAYFPYYSWTFSGAQPGAASNQDDEHALAALYMAFNICTCVYFTWLFFAFNRAYRRLRALPYLETRFRQLSFHFFIFHATWVILYTTGAYLWETLRTPSPLVDDDDFAPDSRCLLITVYLCVLAFVYSPAPKAAIERKTGQQLHVNKTAWLLDIAAHSYADSSHQPAADSPRVPTTLSGDAPGSRGELWQLGLQHEAFLHDPTTDTTVLVASEDLALARSRGRARRLVVAFRGTKSRENFRTDFDFLPLSLDLNGTDRPVDADEYTRDTGVLGSEDDDSMWSPRSSGGSHDHDDVSEHRGCGGCLCGICCCCCCCVADDLLSNVAGLGGLIQPRAHRGFWRAYRSVSPELRSSVHAESPPQLVFEGHVSDGFRVITESCGRRSAGCRARLGILLLLPPQPQAASRPRSRQRTVRQKALSCCL